MTCLYIAALSSAGITRLVGSTGQASETGDFPDDSLQGVIFGILCKKSSVRSYQLGELSALLAAWQVTEAWLPGDVGYSERLRSTQAWPPCCMLIICCRSLTLTALYGHWRSAACPIACCWLCKAQ